VQLPQTSHSYAAQHFANAEDRNADEDETALAVLVLVAGDAR